MKKVIGEEPKLFRPPYRAISKAMCNIVKEKDMNIVLWSNLDPRDWSNPGVYYIVDTITSKVLSLIHILEVDIGELHLIYGSVNVVISNQLVLGQNLQRRL